ncbi:unnamed protein product [Parascedosporium putredinis]|uniref:Uncharacterized protein n=1 Tax=Parascedosporium putredinis TaxID=1442378 RepID=A0A9P1H431_9PEZI|nr:unnamed protein product [Parascedosporium putredinis]CAI7995658.1 unnamed protein product [Parascedosporium putredinis]
MSDPDSFKAEGNPEGIRACEEYELVVKDLQETLQPELEMIDSRIIRPANELLDVIKVIRKSVMKREHKKLDYDRHRTTLKKLQDKKDRTAKDEKAMWKAENDVELSTQEFNYFNDLLKEELPQLFRLEREFIQPLFQSFYYMQLNIFYTLHIKMQECDIGYFDLTLDVEEAFQKKRGDIQEQAELLSICKFKTTGQKRPPKYGSKPALEEGKRPLAIEAGPSSTAPRLTYNRQSDVVENPPPPYSPNPRHRPAAAPTPAVETVTALYDFAAQAEGDLSFKAGDAIQIIKRTSNDNEWWTGKLNGKQGDFPGNYVRLN